MGSRPMKRKKRRHRMIIRLRSKRFYGAKSEERGFRRFAGTRPVILCSRTAQKRLLSRLNDNNPYFTVIGQFLSKKETIKTNHVQSSLAFLLDISSLQYSVNSFRAIKNKFSQDRDLTVHY